MILKDQLAFSKFTLTKKSLEEVEQDDKLSI